MTTAVDLAYRLGELAVAFLEYPDAPNRRRRLEEAVEAYDTWRQDQALANRLANLTIEDLTEAYLPQHLLP